MIVLADLMAELSAYPAPFARTPARPSRETDYGSVVVPLQLTTPGGPLSFFSTTTVFGTPLDITLSELALESFYPADPATADALRTLAAAG